MILREWVLVLLLAGVALPALAEDGLVASTPEDAVLRLTLGPATGTSWDEAALGRLLVRSATVQRRLEAGASPDLDVPLDDGCSLVLAVLEPTAERGTRSTQIVACRQAPDPAAALADRLAVAGTLTDKLGGRIEIRPMRSPTLIAPGSALPVRLYFGDEAQPGAEVTAVAPDGSVHTATSDAVGTVAVAIDREGPWTLRYRHWDGGLEHVAELRFEVPARELWDAMPQLVLSAPEKSAKAAADRWRELGPAPLTFSSRGSAFGSTGRAAAIAPSATRAQRYYVGGASGGVWESVAGGATWTDLNASLPILSIGAVALDPTDDKVIFAGSGEANYSYHSLYGLGLYRSLNRGRRWKVVAPELFAGLAFSRLVISPHDRDVIWAAVARAGGSFEGFEGARGHPRARAGAGIFVSRNRGARWQRVGGRHGLPTMSASDVDLDPIDPNRVHVTIGDAFGRNLNGVYRSNDGGRSFEPSLLRDQCLPSSGEQCPRFGRVTLAIAPSDPDRLYALVAHPAVHDTTGGFFPGGATAQNLFRSSDGGDSWEEIDISAINSFMGGQGSYNTTAIVAPNDPDTLILGGVRMMRSTDAGASFVEITPPHVDLHDTAFDAAGRLLVATDGGVTRSPDLGNTWTMLNDGLGLTQIYPGLALHPDNPNVVLAGFQDNGTNLRTGNSRRWTAVLGGDGGYCVIHPDDPDIMLVQYQGAGNVYRSTDGGLTFNPAATGIRASDDSAFQGPLILDPNDPNRLLYATNRIYESTDTGQTWSELSDSIAARAPYAVRSLVIAPSNSNIVYATTNGGRVLVSSNAGADWDVVREGLGGWPRVLRQIAVDPMAPNQAVLADMRFGGQKVLLTPDRGRTWQAIGRRLPNVPVNTVAIHRGRSRRYIFAGTDAGVFVTRNNGKTWQEYGRMVHVPVMDLVVDLNHGRLVAATLGRGAWEMALP